MLFQCPIIGGGPYNFYFKNPHFADIDVLAIILSLQLYVYVRCPFCRFTYISLTSELFPDMARSIQSETLSSIY